MKKPRKLEEIAIENQKRLIKALPYIAGSRRPRTRPRSKEESDGLAISAAAAVQNAYKSGVLVKRNPKGFIVRWK